MNKKRNVLIFTYYWPPAGGAGVQRFLKFSKFLGEFGWNPIVVTVENGSYPTLDPTLEADVPSDVEVFKTGTFEPFLWYNLLRGKKGKQVAAGGTGIGTSKSLFQRFAGYVRANWFIPDARVGWKGYAIRQGRKLIRERQIDAIISTGPPQSTHLTGLALNKESAIPWIADFRDPWTDLFIYEFLPRTPKTIKKDAFLETQVLKSADLTLTVSHGLKRDFEDRAKRIEVIYNGYDDGDIFKGEAQKTEKFTLEYIGNFKPNQNLPVLWKTLKRLIDTNEDFGKYFQLEFTGKIDQSVVESLKAAKLESNLKINGFVSHSEATAKMGHASILFFVIPDAKNKLGIITGKIFENMACQTPMLCIGPEDGDANQVLKSAGKGPMMGYEDGEMMEKVLLEKFNQWLANGKVQVKDTAEGFKQYSRKSQTQFLAKLLDEITS